MGEKENFASPHIYTIIFQGHLDERRIRQFGGLTAAQLPGGETLLTGQVADQSALHGLLALIRDLGLSLLLVWREDFPLEKVSK